MGSAGAPIVIGGGITPGTPFTVNHALVVSSVSPPTAITSKITSDPVTGDITIPGTGGANSLALGTGVTTAHADGISIGHAVTSTLATATGPMNILIGQGITSGAVGHSNVIMTGNTPLNTFNSIQTVVIGIDIIRAVGVAFNGVTALGYGIVLDGTANGVCIGSFATTTGTNAVAVGATSFAPAQSSVVGHGAGAGGTIHVIMGPGSTSTGGVDNTVLIGCNISAGAVANQVLIGNGAGAGAAGDIIIGNNNAGGTGFSTRLVLGGALLHTNATAVPAFTVRFKNAQGTDIAAGDATIQGPCATGNANSGEVIIATGLQGATGTTVQTATEHLRVTRAGRSVIRGAGIESRLSWIDTAAGNIVGYIRHGGGTGTFDIVAENALDVFVASVAQRFADPTGVNERFRSDATNAGRFMLGLPVRFDGYADGAGAGAGTLLNAPTAGNPAFWLPINIAGAVRYIPCWP